MGMYEEVAKIFGANKKLASTIGIAGASVVAFLQFDGYYAHASDISELRQGQQQAIVTQQKEIRYSTDQIRRQYLEDKLFELNLKTQQTQVDRAMMQKYQRDLDQINDKWKDR